MSKSSEAVKEWRKNTKQKLTICMGSKCQVCGYNKSQNALEFHHINPSEKDFSIRDITVSPKKWDNIKEELSKCILLCANCHREVHEGLTKLPEKFQEFNEELLQLEENKYLLKETKVTYCPVCNKPKENYLQTCSKECGYKKRTKIDWSSIDLIELIEVEQKSKTEIADELGCSDAMVGKKYRELKSTY